MRKYAKLSGEPATLWLARIHAFERMWKSEEPTRRRYRDAAALKFRSLLPSFGEDGKPLTYGVDTAGLDQIPLNISRRYIDRLLSLATDDDPLISYSRDTVEDEETAGMVERLAARVVAEGRACSEFEGAVTSVCTVGSSMIWMGFHADVLSAEEAGEVKKGAGEIVGEVLSGQHQPAKGQDHKLLADTLVAAGSDPVAALGPGGPEAILATHEAAAGHVGAAVEEGKEPDDVSVVPREVWFRRLPVGTWTGWDNAVWDYRDSRWVWRKMVMTKEEARSYAAFDRRVVGQIEPDAMEKSDGYEAVRDVTLDAASEGAENARVTVYEVWDKRYRTRHYVCDGCEFYLEVDPADPNVDFETGESLMPGFFPCVYIAPLKDDSECPKRTLGIPALAPGFPQQEELIKIRSYAMAAAKRCARIFVVPAGTDEDTIAKLENAVDGTVISMPPEVDGRKSIVDVVQWSGEFPAIRAEADRVLYEWAMVMEYPLAELTTQPSADTATQEQIAVGGGNQRTGYVIKRLEAAFAEMVQKALALVRGRYPDEKIVGMLGAKYAAQWAAWKRSSLDGDRIKVKFAGKAKEEQAVQTKQSMDLLMLLRGDISPLGFPKWNTDALLEAVARGLGHELQPYQPTQEDLMALQMKMGAGGPPGGGEEKGGKGASPDSQGEQESNPGVPGAQERAKRPYPEKMSGGAMNVGPR